jgi:hypothetical protein
VKIQTNRLRSKIILQCGLDSYLRRLYFQTEYHRYLGQIQTMLCASKRVYIDKKLTGGYSNGTSFGPPVKPGIWQNRDAVANGDSASRAETLLVRSTPLSKSQRKAKQILQTETCTNFLCEGLEPNTPPPDPWPLEEPQVGEIEEW